MEEKIEVTRSQLMRAFKEWYHGEPDEYDLSNEDAYTSADYLISLIKEIQNDS